MSFELFNINTGGADGCDERVLGPRGPGQEELFRDSEIVRITLECYDILRSFDSYTMEGSYKDLESIAIDVVVEESHELEWYYRSLDVQVDYDEHGVICEYCDVSYYKNNWENYMIHAAQRLIELYDNVEYVEPPKPFEISLLDDFHKANIADREVTV